MAKDSNSSLRNQIYESMQLKETDELREIWERNDHEEWSDTAFEVVKELLLERLGKIPPQELQTIEKESNDLEAISIKSDRNDDKLLKISFWSNRLSWIMLSLYILNFLTRIVVSFQDLFQGNGNSSLIYYLSQINIWSGLLITPILGTVYFVVLQSISEGVLMLMDVDDNGLELIRTYKTKRKKSITL